MRKKIHKSNMTQIAELAGVSVATVSRALNGNSAVKRETREKILEAARQVGYAEEIPQTTQPDYNVISLMIPEFKGEFVETLLDAIDREARKDHFIVDVSTIQGKVEDVKILLQNAIHKKASGVILMLPSYGTDLKGQIEKFPLPIVLINSGLDIKLPTFMVNNYQGAYAMVEHFVNHGYRQLGIIRGPVGNYDADRRHQGFLDALKSHGLHYNPDFDVTGDFSQEGGYYAFSRLLSAKQKPEAVFIANDDMAVGAIEAAERMGVKIPQDIAIGGFDDVNMGRFITPQLTTIRGNIDELGRRALLHLIKIIRGYIPLNKEYHEELSSGLIVRNSCGCSTDTCTQH